MLRVLGEEPSGSKVNDLPLGVMNIVYEAETPTFTTPPATLSEAKTLATQKTSSGIDEQSPEKEDLGAAGDQLESEKDPESGQFVDQFDRITKL